MKRVGLFIGVNEYQNGISKLRYAVNDAKKLSFAFAASGYEVEFFQNDEFNCIDLADKIEYMLKGLTSEDLFVFYFAGHGRQVGNSHYLLSSKARAKENPNDPASLNFDYLLELTDEIPGLKRLFILDCCRTNITADRAGEYTCDAARDISLSGSLNKNVKKQDNFPALILNACSYGEKAYENDESGHGYFTESLLKNIKNKSVCSIQQLQNNLIIENTPGPQNVHWAGSIAKWKNVALFENWGMPEPDKTQPNIKAEKPKASEKSVEKTASEPKTEKTSAGQKIPDLFAKHEAEGVKYSEDYKILVQVPKKITGIFMIPQGVASIGKKAFSSCSRLTGIHIPDSVTKIDNGAFKGCSGLTDVNIPDSVSCIGTGAFCDCTSLSKVRISSAILVLAQSVFKGCSSLTSVHIPDGITKIGHNAFAFCMNLTEIHIPDSVTSIGNGAFHMCPSLTEIHIPDGITSIEDGTFNMCSSLKNIHIPDGVTNIGDGALAHCSNLTSVYLPDSVSCIGSWAFYNCTSLTRIHVPNDTSIGIGAFDNTPVERKY